jgi:pimeloyl-ACP methyl ester carboxylesterase
MSTARVGDVDLFYEEQGSGEPLLLVMGLGADSTAWAFQRPAFAERYRTIVFDNRGVGRSAKPKGPYTIHQMADDAAGLLDHLGIASAHVCGVSMGGMISQELALRHPAKVRSLVLGCTYPEPDADVENHRLMSLGKFGGHISAEGGMETDVQAINPMEFLQHMLPNVFNPEFISTQLPMLLQVFSGALQYGFSMEAILGQVAAVMSHKSTDRLHQIAVPTLVITGDADRLIPPKNSEILADAIPGAKLLMIPGGSHGFNFETPDVFNRAVLDFLDALPR